MDDTIPCAELESHEGKGGSVPLSSGGGVVIGVGVGSAAMCDVLTLIQTEDVKDSQLK
ncbi:MAG: hypothetical protein FAF03_06830 [Epsilonproteobacteria bacterium]|nr:hypothetical protein [Campylobacterota bacterium]